MIRIFKWAVRNILYICNNIFSDLPLDITSLILGYSIIWTPVWIFSFLAGLALLLILLHFFLLTGLVSLSAKMFHPMQGGLGSCRAQMISSGICFFQHQHLGLCLVSWQASQPPGQLWCQVVNCTVEKRQGLLPHD